MAGPQTAKPGEADLLPGSVSRLNAFVPERIGQIEHLYCELLAQAEARYKSQVEQLSAHLEQTEARHKSEVEQLRTHLEGINELLRDKTVSLEGINERGEDRETVCASNCRLPRSFRGFWTMLTTQQPGFALRGAGNWQIR
jgi:hypothetical protein